MFYTIREPFDANHGEPWLNYLQWLGRTNLTQVVTLDGMLCPAVTLPTTDTDGQFVSPEFAGLFTDAAFVLERVAIFPKAVVLAALADPSPDEVLHFDDPRFAFAGYDLVDMDGIASALLNCGGFPNVFSPTELSIDSGLISSYDRAFEIREKLGELHSEDAHADCRVWALWRYRG